MILLLKNSVTKNWLNKLENIIRYFPNLTDQQIDQLRLLKSLYEDWNSKINVISRKDMDSFYTHHVLHSLGIAKVMTFEAETKILDVGTGGGFPGIPLAILFPEAQFHLVDSIGKKITVVQEVAKAIGLKNLNSSHQRAETVDQLFEFVVSRAVTQMQDFIPWVYNKFSKNQFNPLPNGILYLKGGDLSHELKPVRWKHEVFELSNYFSEHFFETKKVVYLTAP